MIKPIVRHGNTRALALDRALLKVAGIDPMGYVHIRIEGHQIILTPSDAPVKDPPKPCAVHIFKT